MRARYRPPATSRRRWRMVVTLLVTVLTLAVTAAAGVVTARLYTPSPLERDGAGIVADALPRLAYLREALDGGAAQRMQQLFPEGYFFSYALYGLTWVDVGMRDAPRRPQALAEARWALSHLDSDAGRAPFSVQLSPPYGVFYAGWTSWLRGGVVRLGGAAEAPRWYADTDALAAAFAEQLDDSGSPFLPAYPGQAWPVDSAVGLAAVALADQLRGGDLHADLFERWGSAADARRDPQTGLLPHRVDAATGYPVEGARASSQALLLRFLREVDPAAAARDWAVFRDSFASRVPGVPGIREHPRGVGGVGGGAGDVDSGPLILGLSASASVVALGSAVLFGNRRTARALTGLAEVTGVPVDHRGQRRYLGGRLPVGDAFLAWSLAADGWVVPAGAGPDAGAPAGGPAGGPSCWWRLPWHAATLWLLAPWWLLLATRTVIRPGPGQPGAARSRRDGPAPGRASPR